MCISNNHLLEQLSEKIGPVQKESRLDVWSDHQLEHKLDQLDVILLGKMEAMHLQKTTKK